MATKTSDEDPNIGMIRVNPSLFSELDVYTVEDEDEFECLIVCYYPEFDQLTLIDEHDLWGRFLSKDDVTDWKKPTPQIMFVYH